MERNTLELAYNSLFIEKIENELHLAEADFLTKAYSFSTQRSSCLDLSPFQAAELPIDQDADAVTVGDALLSSLLQQGHAHPDKIRKLFRRTVADTISDLNSHFIPLKIPSQGKFP